MSANWSSWVVEMLGGKRNGFFLDIGAGYWEHGNNTLLLERDYGWQGIAVEPVPDICAEFRSRRHCFVKQAVIAEKAALVDFYKVGCLSGIKEHMSSAALARIKEQLPNAVAEQFETITFEMLFSEFPPPPIIDYWSLDTEGSELMLLRYFPWLSHSVSLITVEHNYEEAKRALIFEFLSERGFVRVPSLCIYEDFYRHQSLR